MSVYKVTLLSTWDIHSVLGRAGEDRQVNTGKEAESGTPVSAGWLWGESLLKWYLWGGVGGGVLPQVTEGAHIKQLLGNRGGSKTR